MSQFVLDAQVAAVAAADLSTTYAVATDAKGRSTHYAGTVATLAYRVEATFDAATALAEMTVKVQTSRTDDGATDPDDLHWTDLALYSAADPSTAAVEHTIDAATGKTVALDLYSDLAHRGRRNFRLLVKATGDVATGDDAVAAWAAG